MYWCRAVIAQIFSLFFFWCIFSGHFFLPNLLFGALFLDICTSDFTFAWYFFWTLFPSEFYFSRYFLGTFAASEFTFRGTFFAVLFLDEKGADFLSKKVTPKVIEKEKLGNQKVKNLGEK